MFTSKHNDDVSRGTILIHRIEDYPLMLQNKSIYIKRIRLRK